jgi:hypothetical protein
MDLEVCKNKNNKLISFILSSQHDEKHVVPTPLSAGKDRKKKKKFYIIKYFKTKCINNNVIDNMQFIRIKLRFNKYNVLKRHVWCPKRQNKRIAPLPFFLGCRKRRLKDNSTHT